MYLSIYNQNIALYHRNIEGFKLITYISYLILVLLLDNE